MTDAACASCLHPLLPHLELCFDCDLNSAAPPPIQKTLRRFNVTGPPRDPERLAGILIALCPALPPSRAAAMSRRASFDVVADLGPNQEGALTEWIQATGAQVFNLPEGTSPSGAWRYEIDWRTWVKLGVVVALVASAQVLSVQYVTSAGAVMAALLLAQGIQLESAEFIVDPSTADDLLRPVEARLLDQMRAARRATRRTDVLARLKAPMVQMIEVSAALRCRRDHELGRQVKRAEGEAVATMAQLVRMLATVERLSDAEGPGPVAGAYRDPRGSIAVSAATRQLDQVAAALEGLRASPAMSAAEVSLTMIRLREEIENTTGELLRGGQYGG